MTEGPIQDSEFGELENAKILELKEKLMPQPPSVESRLARVLVVDNIPKVGPEKLQKLMTVLEKIFVVGAKAKVVEKGIFLPVNPQTKETYGYAFVEFVSTEDAQTGLEKANGYKLDKDHTLAINYWGEVARLQKTPEEYISPPDTPYKPLENLRWWLTDPCGLDQYAVTYGDEMEIYWAETLRKPRRVYARSRAMEKYAEWSPWGSYLTTVHKDSVKLWGGETWASLKVFAHPDVERIEYSPDESYLVTVSRTSPNRVTHKVCIWEVATGKLAKEFDSLECKRDEVVFKWTHDAKYFGRLGTDSLLIYESSTMELVRKKPIEIPRVALFEWCPTAHYFAAFIPSENENPPASLVMIDASTGMEVYRKTLFSVKSCELQWQSAGRYLGLKVERQIKAKKKVSFEIFTIQTKAGVTGMNVTTQIQNMDDTVVQTWKWEPKGKRFAVIHGEENAPRVKVSFYQITEKELVHKRTFENKPAKRLFWSPVGNIVIIACNQGVMEFYSSAFDEIIGTGEHPLATDLVWDPTGRYVCTFVDGHRQSMDNGYMIHTFKGNVIHKVLKDRFYQFLWRPRPPTLLSAEQQKEINKNIKSIAEKYKKEDAGSITIIVDEQLLERQRLLQEFKDRLAAYAALHKEQAPERVQIRDGRLSDDENDYDVTTETYEELIEEIISELDD